MGAWFESKIMKVSQSTSSALKTEKTSQTKPVLSETSLHSTQNTKSTEGVKDENENKLRNKTEEMEMDSDSTCDSKKTDGSTLYDRLFDILKDDGFLYHIIYEG